MKYAEKHFTLELLEKINNNETALTDLMERLLVKNKPFFAKKGLDFHAEFERKGNDPFDPGYHSSISLAICDENDNLLDLNMITIWECDRYFLGLPVSKKIPGSKIAGELLDESPKDIKVELNEYINEQLSL
ncbi:hypothetical protein [Sutcliffiella horikoshii]|uniref:hypothetical protein n=1 Tax=Sutcliffiella horikoshii TaxID=79883 RepID=UPI00384ABE70